MAKLHAGALIIVALIVTSAIGMLILAGISYLSPFGASLGMNH
jgi:hypothetical protein